MKLCTVCGLAKQDNEFFLQDKSTGRRHTECKRCYAEHRKSYYKAHYLKYGDLYRKRAQQRRTEVRQKLQAQMVEYLSDKFCILCHESDPRVLDFDHLDPNKKSFGIANAISYGKTWEIILSEIQKCQILCANCHRKRTATENGWYRIFRDE